MTIATNLSPQDDVQEHLPDDLADLPDLPPCGLDSDEPQMETHLHVRQMLLLIACLDWLWRDRTDYFASGNLTVYYSQKRIKSRDFRGPDFFVVRGVEQRPRRSWTIWEEEGRYPDLIIEILSDSTAQVDRTTKKELYQTTFRTPEYFWFDPYTLEFQGFYLVRNHYEAIPPNSQGRLWSEQLELFLGIHEQQLRYFTADGELVPTPHEAALLEEQQRQAAEQQRQIAEQQRQIAEQQCQAAEQQRQAAEARAEQEANRATRLANKLRELGVDLESLSD